MALHVVILAAGQGTRMHSSIPKGLHKIAGTSMLGRVLNTARALEPAQIHVVVGYEGEQLQQTFSEYAVNWVWQRELLGTGDAVKQALPDIPDEDEVLVLFGDVPLIQVDLLRSLLARVTPDASSNTPLALLLAQLPDPTGLGRVLRDGYGNVYAIVEEKDATDAERNIREIYSGVCCAAAIDLKRWLGNLNSDNAQGEYYLTGIIAMAADENRTIQTVHAPERWMIQGVNDKVQLEGLERVWQEKQASMLLLQGVMFADKRRVDIRGELHVGQDVFIDVGVVLLGSVTLADGVHVGPYCVLNNVSLGRHTVVEAHSVLEGCDTGEHCKIGPFARVRPGTVLGRRCKIGNFVETKQATFDDDTKASHLSYLGDVSVGKEVNIGAGTITCNYDGVNKHQTIIEDGAFIGSDTQLVAPVTVGKNATLGAGTTLRRSAPADELTLTAVAQKTMKGWKRPQRKEEK
jgi:bifunctional UDP-N-acetylglucosamine pyrophosphorylase / glucosamine-1-phosphate N-acetyltransferase